VAAWRGYLPAFLLTRRRLAGSSRAAAAWLAYTPGDRSPGRWRAYELGEGSFKREIEGKGLNEKMPSS